MKKNSEIGKYRFKKMLFPRKKKKSSLWGKQIIVLLWYIVTIALFLLQDRANLSRISDLESQLSRANTLATQFRKAKEDADRRYHSRVHELQERLDQANATKRSMENYVNFLKSYASAFNDSGTPGSPLPTFNL